MVPPRALASSSPTEPASPGPPRGPRIPGQNSDPGALPAPLSPVRATPPRRVDEVSLPSSIQCEASGKLEGTLWGWRLLRLPARTRLPLRTLGVTVSAWPVIVASSEAWLAFLWVEEEEDPTRAVGAGVRRAEGRGRKGSARVRGSGRAPCARVSPWLRMNMNAEVPWEDAAGRGRMATVPLSVPGSPRAGSSHQRQGPHRSTTPNELAGEARAGGGLACPGSWPSTQLPDLGSQRL